MQPRPLSPHLQVYRPQITTVLSITHRATGFALGLGTLAFTVWLGALAIGEDTYLILQAFWRSTIGWLMLMGWVFCFFFHLGNGIRHLFWDAGYGYEIGSVTRMGWSVIVFAVVCTILIWKA